MRGRNQINIFGPFTDFFSNPISFPPQVITISKESNTRIILFEAISISSTLTRLNVNLSRMEYFIICKFLSIIRAINISVNYIYSFISVNALRFKQRLISSCKRPDATRT